MKAYWSRCGRGQGNFGDKLTPLLLRHFGVRCEWAPVERAELIAIGSVLEKLPEGFKGTIWSTGFMHERSRGVYPHANILALRGRLTRERVERFKPGTVALGDGALLCDLFRQPALKRYKLGIIPHFVDAEDPVVAAIARSSNEIAVIDICADAFDVIARVGECENVVSSSLHGLVLADSLGIPNRWIALNRGSEKVIGGGFKYRDYYSVYDIPTPTPETLHPEDSLASILSRLGPYSRPGIQSIKEALLNTLAAVTGFQPVSSLDRHRLEQEERRQWASRLEKVKLALEDALPRESTLVLADEDQLGTGLQFRRVFPFTEREGQYWGPPGSDELALGELSRLQSLGAEYFAIAFPSFWLLEQFPQFATHLRSQFKCRIEQDDLLVFQLEEARSSSAITRR